MKISIITVCYNSAKTIERTIQSVIAQKYEKLEYIVVDGGSTDGTLEILQQYRGYIDVLISEPDQGIYDAMNKGLQRITGEVFAFLNSDDWDAEGVLRSVREYFQTNDVDMISGNLYRVDAEEIKPIIVDRAHAEDIYYRVLYQHPALFARKAVYDKLGGFDTRYKIAADTDWVMRCCAKGCKVLCVEDYYTYFSVGGISNQKKQEAYREQAQAAIALVQTLDNPELLAKVTAHYAKNINRMQAMEVIEEMIQQPYQYKNHHLKPRYVIWGAGLRGRKCIDIFEALEIEVVQVVDAKLYGTYCGKYRVDKTDDLVQDEAIIITPKGHESDIQEALLQRGIKASQCVPYDTLLEQIVSLKELEAKR